jgi:Domain of unknown function (DUF4114)
MKSLKYSFLFFIGLSLLIVACKKEATVVTKPVEFTTTSYDTLSTCDDSGKPDNLLPADGISSPLITFINTTLPEKTDLRTSYPALLTTSAIADIAITQQSDVFITFVSQGTKFSNTFAFYTYPTNKPPASTKDIIAITHVFPNAGYLTPLKKGDKVKIGRFSPGTSIGFVLLKNAWNTTTSTINNKAVHFCSNDVLNPELDASLKKHAVLINYPAESKVLIGFEDIDRTESVCDHDFNDLLVYCTVTP